MPLYPVHVGVWPRITVTARYAISLPAYPVDAASSPELTLAASCLRQRGPGPALGCRHHMPGRTDYRLADSRRACHAQREARFG